MAEIDRPIIYFANGGSALLEAASEIGATLSLSTGQGLCRSRGSARLLCGTPRNLDHLPSSHHAMNSVEIDKVLESGMELPRTSLILAMASTARPTPISLASWSTVFMRRLSDFLPIARGRAVHHETKSNRRTHHQLWRA